MLSVLAVAVGIGFYASFFMSGHVSAESGFVSGVTLVDTDNTGFGLDGRDFTIVWTPSTTQPTGFQYTKIFITTSTVNLTTSTIEGATGCNGGPCQMFGFFSQWNMGTTTLPQYVTRDSTNANLVTGTQYVAWVFVSTTNPGNAILVSSTAVFSTTTPGSNVLLYDNIADNNPPQVDHSPVHIASSSAAAVINAFVFDDQTTGQMFSTPNGSDGGTEYFRLFYTSTTQPWLAKNFVDAVNYNGSSLYSFTIPTSSVTSGLKYFLVAQDRAGNTRFFCSNPSAAASTTCQSSPFAVNVAAPGIRTVAGTIASGGSALAGAWVFAGGFAGPAVQTNGGGAYTVVGLPNNDAFDFTADKIAHCRAMRSQTIGTASLTGIDMTLNSGECGFFSSGSGGGAGGAPTVMFSAPPDGLQNVLPSMQLRVGLNQPMDGTTINDSNAADAGSNIYLTTDTGTTKIAGSVTWCTNNTSPGCSSLSAMEGNTILFSPSSSLAVSTFFTLVIGPNVKSQGGQAITGNLTGGGHKISFVTGEGLFSVIQMGQLGTSGQFMPPYVKSAVPAPGMSVGGNVNLILEFNQAMSASTINSTNIVLYNLTTASYTTLSDTNIALDSTEQRFVTISHNVLSAGNYEVRVLGAAANASGMSMRPPANASDIAFKSSFTVSGTDNTAPTIYAMTASGATGVAVNSVFNFGFSEQLTPNMVNTTNITLYKGATAVGVVVKYDPGKNNVTVVPNSVLSPNTVYTLTVGSGVTDLANNVLATSTYTYTTGNVDTTAPALKDARCDDYTCKFFFTESMNHDSQVDTNFISSTLNHLNFNLTQGGADKIVAATAMSYDAANFVLTATGVGLTPGAIGGGNFTAVVTGITDLSGNVMPATTFVGPVDDSKQTFGSFGDPGMFGPPIASLSGGSIGGGSFTPMGFGSFTVDQFAFGQADTAIAFNPTASQDANVFEVKFSPGVTVVAGDKVVFTFPAGTDVTNATQDTFSPFYTDFNQFGAGVVTGTAVTADNSTGKVTVTLGVSGSPVANDSLTIDLRKIVNPSIPKSPTTGGYTLGIQLTNNAGTTVKATKTSMPYFVMAGGSNHITINIVAGANTSTPTAGANGTIFMHGGGPAGPMDKNITLTDGAISAVDGTSATVVSYSNLNDGCYFFGTDPFATLGGADYFGQMSPEPVCVNGGASTTKYILLSPASGGSGSVTTTIKLTGIANFNGANIDIFAGGPGKFVVKSLSAVKVPNAAGYDIKLPANGHWFIGVGPSMPKGVSGGAPTPLPGVSPAPVDVEVSGVGTASPTVTHSSASPLPPGVTFVPYAAGSSTITFAFVTADKTVSGTVKDGSGNALSSIEVFMHKQGFGAPIFGTTNASGTFSLSLSDYGVYEIGVFKDGMPPTVKQIEVKPDGADADTDPDVYFDGKQVTGANPLVLTLKKAAYTISGKVLDSNNSGISSAPVSAIDASGNSVFGRTTSDGSYSLYVDVGTWTVKAELPPDKSGDICGTFSKTVTVSASTGSQSSQNITPSSATCYTLSGTVTVGGTNLANIPIFIEEWDSANSKPVAGGIKRGTATDSSGAYSVKVLGGKTYRVGTLSSDYGELGTTATVAAADVSTGNITVASTSSVSFVFTGGNSSMNALIGLKNASDQTKSISKQQTGLATTSIITVQSGVTYNYFVDVFGVGKFSGQVVAGNTATVNLGITSSDYITVTGTIYSGSATTSVLAGALVTFANTSTGFVQTATANASGTYSISISAGTYNVSSNLTGYVPGAAASNATFTTTTAAYDFGGASPDQSALSATSRTIEGYVSSSAGATVTDGRVWAVNASGTVVTAALDSVGHYSLPVTDGVWTVKAVGPSSAETTKSGDVTVSGANSTGNNITLTADATRVPTSTSGIVSASSGGSVNDASASGIKITAGGGVLDTGNGDVTLNLEKTYTASNSGNFDSLGNATFKISATGDSSIKDLKGNAEIQLDYTSMVSQLPAGVSESDLKLMYYSSEKGTYVPVEGGFTIDTTNNTITGQTNHLTDFVITYAHPAPAPAPAAAAAASSGGIASPVTAPKTTSTTTLALGTVASSEQQGLITPEVAVSNPNSSIALSNVASVSYQPGAVMSFEYKYKNEGKALSVRVVRELVNSKGKVVVSSSAVKKLKTGEVFSGKVKEKVGAKLSAGDYAERIRIYNASTKKLLEQNSFTVTVEKLKKKVFGLGEVTSVDSALSFDDASLAKIKSDTVLPVTLKAVYWYTNNTDQVQTIKMVRELLDENGKVLSAKTGKWTLKAGQKDNASFTQPVAGNLGLGSYSVRIRAYDWKTKEMLAENSLGFNVELK